MISVYHWDASRKAGGWLDADALRTQAEALRDPAGVLWINLSDPTDDEERLVYGEFLPVHPLTLEDITRLRRLPDEHPHIPKVEEFPDYLFVVVNPLAPRFLELAAGKADAPGKDGRTATQLSAILTHHILITHHTEPVPSVEWLRSFLNRHDSQAHRGPDYLFHLVLDAIVDEYAPVLDHFDASLDDIEEAILTRPTPELLHRLSHLKREIQMMRKPLVYEREVLARLARGEFALIDEREMVYYRNVYDHLVRFTELIESSRDMVSDLMQMQLAAASNRLNEIMKVLTMISTIVLPMNLIAGIYGMNFEHMPELKWELGYPLALSIMLVAGVVPFLIFRWKKWI